MLAQCVGLLFIDPDLLPEFLSVPFHELELLIRLGEPGLLAETFAVQNDELDLLAVPVDSLFNEPTLLITTVAAVFDDFG